MWYIKHIIDYCKNSYTIVSHWYIIFWLQYTYILFLTLLKITPKNKNTTVSIRDVTLTIPYNFVSFLVMQEIFIEQLYKRLHSLNHILDLGWFIWDSAIYLSKLNNHVTVVESDPRNYALCQLNTRYIPNITLHNAAVTGNDEKRFIISNNEYWWEVATSNSDNQNAIEIPTIAIQELEKTWVDGIKMDIEWGEYDIISHWLATDVFPYKKWFIEFHFFKEHKHSYCSIAFEFILMLQRKWFVFEFFGNDWIIMPNCEVMDAIKHSSVTYEYLNIYFELI